jgi:YidC/Oxa1 family membrane protein insertase
MGTIAVLPGGDVGLAVILITLLVKLVLFPLTQRSIESQIAMKEIEPAIEAIKKEETDTALQNKKIYALYKEKKVNPFSGCLLVLLQLPVIIALYLVFMRGFGDTAPAALYSFVHAPETLNMHFLGLVDLRSKSLLFAALTALSQFFQAFIARRRQGKPSGEGMQAQLAKSMQMQMLYILPILIGFIAYRISAAVALYWITSNIVTIAQELYTLRKMKDRLPKQA